MMTGIFLSGQPAAAKPWALEGVDIPAPFLVTSAHRLMPGTAMLVTKSRVLPSNWGRQFIVLSSS